MELKGIDVSVHNGNISWNKAKSEIDFAIIRAGYGKNNIDAKLEQNAKGCTENSIPFGLYWFSYATSLDGVKKEADYVCDLADKYHPTYPVCFDWEYDSDNYATKQGVNLSNAQRASFAKAFLSRVEERGYYAMLYANPDYLSKGFSDLTSRFDLWLANWDVSKPSVSCGIWQKSSTGKVTGISGNIDLNISYKDYTKYSKKTEAETTDTVFDELDAVLRKIKSEGKAYEALQHFADILLD